MLTRLIDTWLAMRRAQGFALRHYERDLHRFSEFAAARGEDHMRTETAVAWARQAGTPGQRRRHFQRLVQLARFLHAEDQRHEVPPDGNFPGSRHRAVPYIYTADEARGLIDGAARLGPPGSLRPRTMSALLALLFATGLRISEALALRIADVTPDSCSGTPPGIANIGVSPAVLRCRVRRYALGNPVAASDTSLFR